jgi:hypothetical protein
MHQNIANLDFSLSLHNEVNQNEKYVNFRKQDLKIQEKILLRRICSCPQMWKDYQLLYFYHHTKPLFYAYQAK